MISIDHIKMYFSGSIFLFVRKLKLLWYIDDASDSDSE